ncbi:semaphorin-4E [Kryptolebias marmoratus]|uniref:Semaphorin 4e n=1 Tax=Kryptolebias marmoratus TaxID=37003 RepID=A0A3Q3F7L2_KRYMA|nr:semaphorin-4E [Kryptolebias marmoratus]XP_017277755.1 semaphorin-4E [Kryptolebias marmoratus]
MPPAAGLVPVRASVWGTIKSRFLRDRTKGAMQPLLSLGVFCLLPVALTLGEGSPQSPRKSVPYHSDNALQFREEGVFNYSTMLLREDLGLLVLGAREAVFALNLSDISQKHSSIKWEVAAKKVKECEDKGKDRETECKNYIRILHTMKNGRMYVCGTNAFDPECGYLDYKNESLTFEETKKDGKGKCPFDPFQRHASVMVDDQLYSATSMNFLGSEPILIRSDQMRTEFKSSWLYEPNFVSMTLVPEGQHSKDGDDDKVYLFFSETAVEFDSYSKVVVPRVARVCKGDRGGERTLQTKWTSFLKTRIDCPVLNSKLPYLIQDSYLWCDATLNWESCVFFAVFTPQLESSDLSAVCAYKMSDISKVFSQGKYKTPVSVETSYVKWVMYNGRVPVPRPGACINNEARNLGIKESRYLPDQTLQFIKDRPLLDQAVEPIEGRPLLLRRGASFTRIVVDQVQAADGHKYHVMFIATEKGTMLKAVNSGKETFNIEEVEIFQPPQPIKIVTLSNAKGQIYAGADSGAAQIPLASCERSSSCVDCVLARDPYCGWDSTEEKCVSVSSSPRKLIQSVTEGDASLCTGSASVKSVGLSGRPGDKLQLSCLSPSNLGKGRWERRGKVFASSPRLQILPDELVILNATADDSGHYRCSSVEHSEAGEFTTAVVDYEVRIESPGSGNDSLTPATRAQTDCPSVAGLRAAVALLVIGLTALLAWIFYEAYPSLPWTKKSQTRRIYEEEAAQTTARSEQAESKLMMSEAHNSNSNNN